jgi:murein DD-endopeptidase MepM/ murein hydrolase activator NlpD
VLSPFRSSVRSAAIAASVLALSTAVLWPSLGRPARPARAATIAAGGQGIPFKPAYFRPVIVDGKAFPVARSNFLSLLAVPNNWHAPRLRLIDGEWKLVGLHEGIDISAERGTPVVSMTPGIVENAGWSFYSGTRVGVRGDDGRYYLYAHLSIVASGAGPGARVEAGSLLGLIGNTGYGPEGHRDEFPPHLHFGILAGSEWVNPYPTLRALYEETIRVTDREQDALDRLAASSTRRAWDRAAARLYMNLDGLPGE